MSVNTGRQTASIELKRLRKLHHPDCVVCSASDALGLHISFTPDDNGGVSACFEPNAALQSYSGVLHGGIVALLLDSAMTNCLFTSGITAVTGGLEIRYRRTTDVGRPILVSARLTKSRPPLHLVEGTIRQDGTLVARASGKFIEVRT